MHPLHQALVDATEGRFPRVDGGVEVHPPADDGQHAVVEFTGHSFVLTDREPAGVIARGADGFGGASHPDVLRWLAGATGWIGSMDVVLVARGTGGGTLPRRSDLEDHPRVVRSRVHRRNVRVHGDATGVITLGNGLVDRLELSIELFGPQPRGTGRALLREALGLVPMGDLVFAQVAPGNAASLRAFLSCGFTPIGSETLVSMATIVS